MVPKARKGENIDTFLFHGKPATQRWTLIPLDLYPQYQKIFIVKFSKANSLYR